MGEAIALLLFAAVFIGIGIYSLKKKTPTHFWSVTTVKTEEISNVKSYNKENGIMWLVYGSTYIISAILSLFGSIIAPIIVILSSTVGLIILVLVYQRIYMKYKA